MPASDYVKLEQRLVLAAWACQQLGYTSNKAMLEDLRERDEGFTSDGRSHLVSTILARGAKCLVLEEDLARYDANVRSHLAYFNKHRKETLALRYFQHLSLLITELFLDKLFNHEKTLRAELNKFVADRNSKRGVMDAQDPEFTDEDLTKLAFWMATGSGKTILMHFHYRQFLHYNTKPLDNILLVTPDEGLSQQHLENMEAAGIPCGRFSLEDSGFEAVKKNTVRVIEITKLVEEKKGSGVSVPVEAFEGNNLIFVDEGHRGASSEANKWLGYRAKLAETGFTFEYSATFGQAMFAAKDEALMQEYGKANVLKKYTESFYRKRQHRWDSERMEYKPITKNDDNFRDYVVKVPRSEPDLIKAVKEIIDEGKRIYKELCADLPGLYLKAWLEPCRETGLPSFQSFE